MGDYIGIKNLCDLCIFGTKENSDATICNNENSRFYKLDTRGLLLAPCFIQKKMQADETVEYVGFGE